MLSKLLRTKCMFLRGLNLNFLHNPIHLSSQIVSRTMTSFPALLGLGVHILTFRLGKYLSKQCNAQCAFSIEPYNTKEILSVYIGARIFSLFFLNIFFFNYGFSISACSKTCISSTHKSFTRLPLSKQENTL